MRLFFRDVWFHLKRTWCILRRKHVSEKPVGTLQVRGFRAVEVLQCAFCTELVIPLAKQKRLGGKL